MKILLVCPDTALGRKTNPFIRTLKEELELFEHNISNGIKTFWSKATDFDLIIFQWPELIFEWKSIDESHLLKLEKHLDYIKAQGVKTLITCHNLTPHKHDLVVDKLYQLLYSKVDSIHHLGRYSYELLKKRYSSTNHFISPHPIYYDLKKQLPSREACCNFLGLPKNKLIVLSFGEFRNNEERDYFLKLRKEFPNIYFYAPRFINGKLINKNPFKTFIFAWKYIYYSLQGMKITTKFIDESHIPYYFGAVDILYIQRQQILNSGNVPLGYSAGLLVVGPKEGNVGTILEETENITYKARSFESIKDAFRKAADSYQNNRGNKNYELAINEWIPSKTVEIIHKNILKLTNK